MPLVLRLTRSPHKQGSCRTRRLRLVKDEALHCWQLSLLHLPSRLGSTHDAASEVFIVSGHPASDSDL